MIYDHANRALGVLIAKSKAAGGRPMKVFSHLFNTLVLSRMEYSAAIYGQLGTSLCSTKSSTMHYASFLD